MSKNCLILSCGAKVALVRAFHEAASQRGVKVFVSDISPTAAALYEIPESLELPRWDSAGYSSALRTLCRENDIGLIVPTSDHEITSLASIATELRQDDVHALLPSAQTITQCQDKLAFTKYCQSRGFPAARLFSPDNTPDFPVFVRPRFGNGGIGAGRVENSELLHALYQANNEILVQEFIDAPEFSIDLLMDLEPGRALQAVARKRVTIRGGEAQVSQTVQLDLLTDMAMELGQQLGLVGHNVVQAFYSPQDGVNFIEINPRFGGASSLSIAAGLDSPGRLLDLASGLEAARRPREIRYGLTLMRYGEDRFIELDKVL